MKRASTVCLSDRKKIQDGPKHNWEAKTKLGHKTHTQRSMTKDLCWSASNTRERQTLMKMGTIFFYISALRLIAKACPSFLACYHLGVFQVFPACVQGHFLQDHDQSSLQSYPVCHGILQARILEWADVPSSMGSSWLRDQTWVSCIDRGILYHWATREALTWTYSWAKSSTTKPILEESVD